MAPGRLQAAASLLLLLIHNAKFPGQGGTHTHGAELFRGETGNPCHCRSHSRSIFNTRELSLRCRLTHSYRFLLEEPFLYSSPWNIHTNQLMESERTLDERKNKFSKRHPVSRCSSRSRTAPCRLSQVALRLWRHYSLKASAFLGSAVKCPGQHLNWLLIMFKTKSKVFSMLAVG